MHGLKVVHISVYNTKYGMGLVFAESITAWGWSGGTCSASAPAMGSIFTIMSVFTFIFPALFQVALTKGTEPVVLAELMPRHWSDFVRNAPLENVKPLGLK